MAEINETLEEMIRAQAYDAGRRHEQERTTVMNKVKLKGGNDLKFCKAQVIDIFQNWLDKETNIQAEVTNVKERSMDNQFEVFLAEKEQAE